MLTNHDRLIMNQTITMGHVPAVRAYRGLRAVNVRKMCARAISLARRKYLTIAAISAIATYAGVIIECDPLTFSAAFAALGSICLADKSRKGGEA